MKKIILVSTLLIASIGFSQQEILQDFEANRKENPGFLNIADPFGGAWVERTNIYGNNRFVMMLAQANGEVWQGVSFSGFSRNIDLTTDKTMTMDVYSNSAIDLAVKVIGGLDGAPSSTTDLSHTGSGWETLTANFNKGLDNTATANGVYTGLAIHLLWDSSTNNFLSPPILRRVYIDNITGVGTDPVDPVVLSGPTTDAPTPPTRLATDVISIFSDAYANINVTNFNPDWQQRGSVDANYDPTGNGANKVLAYTYFNYQGTEFNTQDASEMDYFHLDVWTDTPGAVLRVSPINDNVNGGTGVPELLINVPLVNAGWSSVDIPKSSFSGMTWGKLYQLKFSGETGTNPSNVYIDNIYFWKAP